VRAFVLHALISAVEKTNDENSCFKRSTRYYVRAAEKENNVAFGFSFARASSERYAFLSVLKIIMTNFICLRIRNIVYRVYKYVRVW